MSRFVLKAFLLISFLLQATGTFKFPDLFPKPDAQVEEPAQEQADTPSEEPEPLRWFWRHETLQVRIYEVSDQSLASPEWHWFQENGTVIVLPSERQPSHCSAILD